MNCGTASVLMSERLDGRLSEETVLQLDDHLRICESCRARWRAMRQVSRLFQTADMALPPPAFTGRVMGRLATREAEIRRAGSGGQRAWLAWGAMLSALLLVCAVAVLYVAQTPGQGVATGAPAFDFISASMQVSSASIRFSALVESNLSIIYSVTGLLPRPVLLLAVLWLIGGTLGLAFTLASVVSAYQPLQRVAAETTNS